MNTEAMKQFITLTREKRDIEAALRDVKNQLTEIEPAILHDFEHEGIDSVKIDGSTLFLFSQIWAGVADGASYADACRGLKEAGLGDLVEERFNTQRLSAYFRELAQEAENLDDVATPDGVALTERFSVRVRAA